MKTRYFSPVVDCYFRQWIALSTWDSMHPADLARFYQFLKALRRYSRKHWATSFSSNIVEAAKQFHPERDEGGIQRAGLTFLHMAEIVFAYESAPFPDVLVEMRDPYAVSLYLRTLRTSDEQGEERPLYTGEEIEEILAERFGRGWRTRETRGKVQGK